MQDDVVISQAMLDDALDVILPLEEGGVDALGPVSPACGGGCWGPLLGETAPCSFDFQRPQNPGHFKNKFCPACRAGGILLPVSRVRALPAEQVAVLKNGKGEGVWSSDLALGPARFRLCNHTAKCSGPPLLLLRDPDLDPALGAFAALPSHWTEGALPQTPPRHLLRTPRHPPRSFLRTAGSLPRRHPDATNTLPSHCPAGGTLLLRVSKGTLVPAAALQLKADDARRAAAAAATAPFPPSSASASASAASAPAAPWAPLSVVGSKRLRPLDASCSASASASVTSESGDGVTTAGCVDEAEFLRSVVTAQAAVRTAIEARAASGPISASVASAILELLRCTSELVAAQSDLALDGAVAYRGWPRRRSKSGGSKSGGEAFTPLSEVGEEKEEAEEKTDGDTDSDDSADTSRTGDTRETNSVPIRSGLAARREEARGTLATPFSYASLARAVDSRGSSNSLLSNSESSRARSSGRTPREGSRGRSTTSRREIGALPGVSESVSRLVRRTLVRVGPVTGRFYGSKLAKQAEKAFERYSTEYHLQQVRLRLVLCAVAVPLILLANTNTHQGSTHAALARLLIAMLAPPTLLLTAALLSWVRPTRRWWALPPSLPPSHSPSLYPSLSFSHRFSPPCRSPLVFPLSRPPLLPCAACGSLP